MAAPEKVRKVRDPNAPRKITNTGVFLLYEGSLNTDSVRVVTSPAEALIATSKNPNLKYHALKVERKQRA